MSRVIVRRRLLIAYILLVEVVIIGVVSLASFLYWKPHTVTVSEKPSISKSTATLSGDLSLAEAQAVFGGAPTPDRLVPGSQISGALPPTSQCQVVNDEQSWAAFLCSG